MRLWRGIFDLDGTPAQKRLARRTIDAIDYDWAQVKEGLARRGRTSIGVMFAYPLFKDAQGHDIGREFAGQSITRGTSVVFVNPDRDELVQSNTLTHELGHQVSDLTIGPAKRDAIHLLFHPKPLGGFEPWSGTIHGIDDPAYLGYAEEGFAIAFGHVFAGTPSALQGRFTHKLKKADYATFRAIVERPRGNDTPLPPVIDPPPTEPEPIDPMDVHRAHYLAIIEQAESGLETLNGDGA